jgi:Leucine-rich repeat (LRR) protein
MKQVFTYLKSSIAVFLCIAILAACSNDDAIETILTTKDFETTIEENPTEGKELGTIEADVNQGTLVYSLISENSKGSLAIDDKGNLTVKDASLYDYETLQKITATVQVKSGEIIKEISVNVLITNVDECIVFKDANFKKALLDHVDPVIDTNADGEICETEARVVKKLQLNKKEISDLYGIQFFTAVTELNCSLNNLTTLDISKNTKLNRLQCSYNKLTTLDVSKNTVLEVLDCYLNDLTILDVSENTKLIELYCNYNDLTTLDVSKNTALTLLNCGGNDLTTLDVSKNTMLEVLDCYQNDLTALNVNNNTALKVLNCYLNDLATLDVSKNTKLKDLDCKSNRLTTLDVSQNTELNELQCNSNRLTTLDVSKNTMLKELYCFANNLTKLDLSKNIALKELGCYSNNLISLNLKNGKNSDLLVVAIFNNIQLSCVEVDDPDAPYLTSWQKDNTTSYSNDCSSL